MTRTIWAALTGLILLTGCGAGEPPFAQGGMDLTDFWNSAP